MGCPGSVWRSCHTPGSHSSELQQTGELTLLIGSERQGLPESILHECEHVANIPIQSESLNAAMATTVALYELTRGSVRVGRR